MNFSFFLSVAMDEFISNINTDKVKSIMLLLTMGAIIVRYMLARFNKRTWPVTVALLLLATITYFGLINKNLVGFLKTGKWSTYHYFMGSKYFEDLGYYGLYRYTLLADVETGTHRLDSLKIVRHLENYKQVSRNEALALARRELPQYFTEQRWKEFKNDWVAMAGRAPVFGWNNMLNDRGFNPPPFWNVLPGFVAQFVPVSDNQAYMYIRNFDFLIKVAAYILLGVLCGLDIFLLVFLFVELAFYNPGHQVATYFQFIFLSTLIAGMALYRSKKLKSAAALLAASAMLRIFPVVFMFGPSFVWLRKLIATRKLPKKDTVFVFAFAAFCILYLLLGLTQGGVKETKQFFENITMHAEHQKFDYNKFGLDRALAVDLLDPWADTGPYALRIKCFVKNKPIRWAVLISAFALFAAVILRKVDNDHWALPLGMLLIFVLMVSSRYYYLVMVVFLIPGREYAKKGFATLSALVVFGSFVVMYSMPLSYVDGRAMFTATNIYFMIVFLMMPVYLLIYDFLKRRKEIPELESGEKAKAENPAKEPSAP